MTMIKNLVCENCFQTPFIMKRLYNKKEQHYISLCEMFKMELNNIGDGNKLSELGVEVVDNSPEEIYYLAIEAEERLNNKWDSNNEDKILQRKFWLIFCKYSKINIGDISVKVGAKFLRDNIYLLND